MHWRRIDATSSATDLARRDDIAAIYARKSTQQKHVAADQKSVERQEENAHAFGDEKGWTMPDEFVIVDDAVSGADFNKRPGVIRLRDLIGSGRGKRAPFSKLIVADLDRVGREGVATAMLLKDLDEAGVEVWTYLDKQPVKLDSPLDVMVLQMRAAAAAIQWSSGRKHVLDAMHRKFDAGYSTGARTYGYRSERVEVAGKYSHSVKRKFEPEAAIVRRVFDRALTGIGSSVIAKELTADRIPTPKGKGAYNWNPATVDDILDRALYKGVAQYHKTHKRNKWGSEVYGRNPRADWREKPSLADVIVQAKVWDAVQKIRRDRAPRYHHDGFKGGRQRNGESKYFLSGFGRCDDCGGTMMIKPRRKSINDPGGLVYACTTYQKGLVRNGRKCTNSTRVTIGTVDTAVLRAILSSVKERIDPKELAAEFVAELERRQSAGGVRKLRAEIRVVERERDNYTRAIGRSKNPDDLITERNAREDRLQVLRGDLADATDHAGAKVPSRDWLSKRIAERIATFDTLLTAGNVRDLRTFLRSALVDGAFRFKVAPAVVKRTRINGTNTGRFEIIGQIDTAPLMRTVVGDVPLLRAPGTRRTSQWIIPVRAIAA